MEPQDQLVETQRSEELYLFSLATSNKRAQLTNTITSGNEHSLNYGKEAVFEIVPVVESYLLRELDSKRLYQKPFLNKHVKPLYDAFLEEQYYRHKKDRTIDRDPIETLSEAATLLMVSTISKEIPLSTMVSKISKSFMMIMNVPYSEREELTPSLMKTVVGLILSIEENTEIFVVEQRRGRENVICATEAWLEHITQCTSDINVNADSYAPMVCEPIPHEDLISGSGGYLTMESPLIKTPNKVRGRISNKIQNFNKRNNPEFFEVINRIQSTPFTVNTKLYDIISDYYSRGFYFKSNPIEETQGKEEAIEEAIREIERRNSKRESFAVENGLKYEPLLKVTEKQITDDYVYKVKAESKKTQTLFQQCEHYSEFDKIYFPMFFDFRGRRYPYSTYGLTYMGDELTKSLLQFADKEAFTYTGIKNLFYNLGNTLGYDKINSKTKGMKAIKWYKENRDTFKSGNFDTFFTNQDEFDEPINALAIVVELLQVESDRGYKSGYMAHRDARCSGSSIIGSLLGDVASMTLTSVYEESPSERLPDAYMAVANQAHQLCKELNTEDSRALLEHSDILFSRAAFKKPVMTKAA